MQTAAHCSMASTSFRFRKAMAKNHRYLIWCIALAYAWLSVLATTACSNSPSVPQIITAEPSGNCDAPADAGSTLSFGSALPNLEFTGEGGNISLRTFATSCSSSPSLLVLRTVAGWCGTCRWHSDNTSILLADDVASRAQIVALLLANDDNQPQGVPWYGGPFDSKARHGPRFAE